jgi:chaperonin cofactor prefoldin
MSIQESTFELFQEDLDEKFKELRRYIQTVAAMCAKANPTVDYIKILDEISKKAEDTCELPKAKALGFLLHQNKLFSSSKNLRRV